MSINRNNAYLLYSFFKVTLTKVSNAISFKTILNNRFLVFKIQRLYCHEYVFWKLFNLQKPRYWEER